MSECTKGTIEYTVEVKKGWRILLIDNHKRDILHGYSRDFAESNAKKLVRRWNAFEDGGIVEELRTALENLTKQPQCKGCQIEAKAALAKS